MKAGKADPMEIFPQGTTRDTVASKLGIGSGKQYEKEKFISDNCSILTPKDFNDWDKGKLSTNKAYQKIKDELNKQINADDNIKDTTYNTKQKKIRVYKIKNTENENTKNIYGTINKESMYKALQDLKYNEFKIYMYIVTNQDGYEFNLSTKDISNKTGTDKREIQKCINNLIKKGYIIQQNDNRYIFVENLNLCLDNELPDTDGIGMCKNNKRRNSMQEGCRKTPQGGGKKHHRMRRKIPPK